MTCTLLLLRHAKSDWGDSQLSDHERPLNRRGRAAAPRVGRLLAERGLIPQLMVVSDARRTLETAELVAQACGYSGEIRSTRQLYLAPPSTYLDMLLEVEPGTQRVLLLGHNPGIAQLHAHLAGVGCDMPTAALSQFELSAAQFASVDGTTEAFLRGYWVPRDLK